MSTCFGDSHDLESPGNNSYSLHYLFDFIKVYCLSVSDYFAPSENNGQISIINDGKYLFRKKYPEQNSYIMQIPNPYVECFFNVESLFRFLWENGNDHFMLEELNSTNSNYIV